MTENAVSPMRIDVEQDKKIFKIKNNQIILFLVAVKTHQQNCQFFTTSLTINYRHLEYDES